MNHHETKNLPASITNPNTNANMSIPNSDLSDLSCLNPDLFPVPSLSPQQTTGSVLPSLSTSSGFLTSHHDDGKQQHSMPYNSYPVTSQHPAMTMQDQIPQQKSDPPPYYPSNGDPGMMTSQTYLSQQQHQFGLQQQQQGHYGNSAAGQTDPNLVNQPPSL